MDSVEKARKWTNKEDEVIFRGKTVKDWEGIPTWLIMPLINARLIMKSDKVFIKWLLIERKNTLKKHSFIQKHVNINYFNQLP